MSSAGTPERTAPLAGDDTVLPFAIRPLGVRGRIVRLGAALDWIIKRHAYPEPVSRLLGEAVALTAMLGASLKFAGKLILQTSTDGPVGMLVVDYTTPGDVRGYAAFDGDRLAGHGGGDLLGNGHLAMTIDQGGDMDRYQGIVALDGHGLAAAAHNYFAHSEQIPTRLRLACSPLVGRGAAAGDWRAGAIMVQHLPPSGGSAPIELAPGDAPPGYSSPPVREDDDWVKARLLLDTTEDHELLDPTLAGERLLYRLFHEDGVRVFPPHPITARCSCSRRRTAAVVDSFSADERRRMAVNGEIVVTCEFCSTHYRFPAEEAGRSA